MRCNDSCVTRRERLIRLETRLAAQHPGRQLAMLRQRLDSLAERYIREPGYRVVQVSDPQRDRTWRLHPGGRFSIRQSYPHGQWRCYPCGDGGHAGPSSEAGRTGGAVRFHARRWWRRG